MRRECRARRAYSNLTSSLGCFDVGEGIAIGNDSIPIDIALVR